MGKRKFEAVVKKNDEVEILIEDLGSTGEGIGRIQGYTLFVKDALPEELVRVRVTKTLKSYGYARLVKVIRFSPHREEPVCELASKCGGCQLMHLDYEKQLEYKQCKIKSCLERIGGFFNIEECMEPVIGMVPPYHYRNKAQFPFGKNKAGRVVAGFYAERTHSIIDMDHCYIQAKVSEEILILIKWFMEEYQVPPYDEATHSGLVRHVLIRVGAATGEIMVCFIINGRNMPCQDILVNRLKTIKGMKSICLNYNEEKTNVILGQQVVALWGNPFIIDFIGDVRFRISPLSFYQINPVQTRRLYETALEFAGLTGNEVVWDIYCGIGTISLFLASKAKKVYGVEIVPQAIEDARENARINCISNAEFFVGAAEEILPKLYQERGREMAADVVVVDPPRKGCDVAALKTIVELQPKRIVYISCDPATLARDARYLCNNGYEIGRVRGCDMFAQTYHVECVCLMTRKEK